MRLKKVKELNNQKNMKLEKEEKTNHTALFGYWGGGVNLADGNHTFFNYPDNMKRADVNQYTLMPTHLRQFFTLNELKQFYIRVEQNHMAPRYSWGIDLITRSGIASQHANIKLSCSMA